MPVTIHRRRNKPNRGLRMLGARAPSAGTTIGGRRPDAAGGPSRSVAPAPAMEHETGPLFAGSEANEPRSRWDAIQVGFVDEPRGAVEHADNLVAATMKRLAEIFAEERN